MEWTANDIKQLRQAYKLTLKALGERLGVSLKSVYYWERGERVPSKTTKILLSKISEELQEKEAKENGKRDFLKG
ncbi:MAG: helix-turn-helix transcriptional regulator [Nitrospirae bacterium]|nr:helix-turn-helix transcriptional regulator [Nitrospirota bacterium]